MAQSAKQLAKIQARNSIGCCEARVAGMRIRAEIERPTAAVGSFPYPHRTCAQWMSEEDIGRSPVKRRGRVA